MQTLLADLRYGLRQFRLAPVFTVTAAFTLALGIGGTTAIFSLIHSVMLRSLPVGDPAALYRVGDSNDCCMQGGPQDNWGMFNYPLFKELTKITPEFESLTAFQSNAPDLGIRRAGETVSHPAHSEFVDGKYFSVLGIRPYVGRLLSTKDDHAAAQPTLVVSYRAWQAKYGADPRLVGSTLVVEGHPFVVAGIALPGFYGETLRSDPPDIWLPLQQEPLIRGPNSVLHQSITAWLRVIGRVRPGQDITAMGPRLTAFLRRWLIEESGYPPEFLSDLKSLLPKQVIHVVPAGSGVMAMKEEYSRTLYILFSVCGLVLAIACANIANLMLARGMVRRTDISLRMALGASRGRLVRQSLTECVTLALIGGLLGLVVADGAGRIVLALAFDRTSIVPLSTDLSWPVLGFALGASVLTGILFGTAPALFATHTQPIEALRGANRITGDSATLPQRALLVVQATLSVILVAGACMLTRSLGNLESQNFGLDTRHRVQVYMNPPPPSYSQERLDVVYRNLLLRLESMKGVENVGIAKYNPLTDNWGEGVYIQGHPKPAPNANNGASWDRVSSNFFKTAGQPLIRGRSFNDHDREGSEPVAIVNEAFVKKFLKDKEDPLASRFGLDVLSEAGRFQIVGVVRDAKYTQPQEPVRAMFFLPLQQHVRYENKLMATIESTSHFANGVLIESSRNIASLEPELRKVCSEVDPNITVIDVRSMREQVDGWFSQQRAVARLASIFGIIALLLASVGLYGVTAYTVARRTGEIGVRMALGASRGSVVGLVMRGAFLHVGLGLILGIPLSILAGKLMGTQLYGLSSADPLPLSIAVLALAIAASIAAVIPAGRAASIDPMRALRVE